MNKLPHLPNRHSFPNPIKPMKRALVLPSMMKPNAPASPSAPTVQRVAAKTVAPPVYRPQPVPKVLQTKRVTTQLQSTGQEPRKPLPPPVYRPSVNTLVQSTTISQFRTLHVDMPEYRPEQKRVVRQDWIGHRAAAHGESSVRPPGTTTQQKSGHHNGQGWPLIVQMVRVYRGGSGTADNHTPRPGIDDDATKSKRGLSCYDKPNGKGTIIETDNLPNNLEAVKEGSHYAIRPKDDPDASKLKTWAATRGTGVISANTQGVLDAIVGTTDKNGK